MSLHPIFDGRDPGSRTHRSRIAPPRSSEARPRRTFRPRPDFLEDRTLLSTVTWTAPVEATGMTVRTGAPGQYQPRPTMPSSRTVEITVTVSGSPEINQLTSQAAIDITGSFTVDCQSTIDNALTIEPGSHPHRLGQHHGHRALHLGTGGTPQRHRHARCPRRDDHRDRSGHQSTLDQRTLINDGTAVWTGDGEHLRLSRRAVFDNLGSLDLASDAEDVGNPGAYPDYPDRSGVHQRRRAGQERRRGGTGDSGLNVEFLTTGTVHVEQGNLGLGGYDVVGTSTGQILADPGTSLELEDLDLDANSSVSGDTVSLYTVNDAGSYSATSGTTAYNASLTGASHLGGQLPR